MKAIRLIFTLSCAVTSATHLFAAGSRPDLSGSVTEEDGTPLPKATVFIYTAGPKHGSASVCPSCYPDCRKKAQTGADGRFKIESLDPQLIFRLLVVASAHQSRFVTNVNPAAGEQKIFVETLGQEALKSRTRITGLIIGEDGKPAVGAVIGPEGVQRGSSTQWGGTDRFVDPVAVADEKGHFLLLCQDNIDAVHATVEGRGLAKRWVELKPGRDHLVRLQEGTTVTGLIERNDRPLKDVLVGLATTDRACGKYFHCDELATDKDGRFVLPNVPPEREFVLYATMESLRGEGVVPGNVITTGKTGTTADVGKLIVQAGHLLAGRVALSDHKPIPNGTRLLLGREQAWDHTEALLDVDGRFQFKGVPAESVGLSLRIKGYKFSKRNPNLDWLNGGIVGRVDRDITDLTLLLEPGEWRYNGVEEEDLPAGAERQPRTQPLRGAKM